jgi:hypothetical protein
MAYRQQFFENEHECNECRNMEREILRLETRIDLLEQANQELKRELAEREATHAE